MKSTGASTRCTCAPRVHSMCTINVPHTIKASKKRFSATYYRTNPKLSKLWARPNECEAREAVPRIHCAQICLYPLPGQTNLDRASPKHSTLRSITCAITSESLSQVPTICRPVFVNENQLLPDQDISDCYNSVPCSYYSSSKSH